MRLLLVALVSLIVCSTAGAHLVSHPPKNATVAQIHASQLKNLAHNTYVCRRGAHTEKRWACNAVKWLTREAAQTAPAPAVSYDAGYWASVQIRVATIIGAASAGDPWPNCPDPFDGGGSWYDTVRCENGGNWLDSPGYYRCGLQFDPGWERKYGRLCP